MEMEMSLEDICDYLSDQRFSRVVIDSFKEQDLDGSAIIVGMASSPGPDWLKDVIPILGTRLKVHQALRSLMFENQNVDESSCVRGASPANSTISVSAGSSAGSSSIASPKLIISSSITSPKLITNTKRSASDEPSSPRPAKRRLECLPEPFPIPTFRSTTECNLRQKVLIDGDRRYIVQTLATVLMTHIQRPSLSHCDSVAKSLISVHNFLKDEEGDDGEHSWKWFIYNRCQNVNRKSKPAGAAVTKDDKGSHSAVHFVPPVNAEDDESYKRNMVLLDNEWKRTKPRSLVLKDLLRRTFNNRWKEYTTTGMSLSSYLEKFPQLKKPPYAAQEFALIANNNCLREKFEAEFSSWNRAIVNYCKDTQVKNTALQEETKDFCDETDEGQLAMIGLRCLTLLFAPLKKKKLERNIPFILKIVPNDTPPSEASETDNNQPHIVLLEDEEEILQQYFISVEQNLLMQCSSLPSAMFFCVAAHYIYNLSYHSKTGDVWTFIQEKVLQIPSKRKSKKNASASTHFAGITRMLTSQQVTSQEDSQ